MKWLKIIIISIIVNILLIGVIYNFINRKYLNNENIITKTLTETEYESQIDSLNRSYQNYRDYIETSKVQLAESITYMGVKTSNLDSLETMASNIRNISSNLNIETETLTLKENVYLQRLGKLRILNLYSTTADSNGLIASLPKSSDYPFAKIACSSLRIMNVVGDAVEIDPDTGNIYFIKLGVGNVSGTGICGSISWVVE